MKLEFEKLLIKNFLSFGNVQTEIEFKDGIANIKGKNLDVDAGKENGSSNGSGKSTINQALTYALYGKGVDPDIKQDDFINMVNGKGMFVELHMKVDGKHVVITRTRKPNSLKFVVDSVDLTRDSLQNTSKLIEEYIGVNYDTFVFSFLMTTSVPPLLKRKPAEQRNFMEEFLGMSKLTERAKSVKALRDEYEVDLKLARKDLENAEEINAREIQIFQNNKEKYDQYFRNQKQRISELNDIIKSSSSVLESEEKIRSLFSRLSDLKAFKSNVSSDINTGIDEIRKIDREIHAAEISLNSGEGDKRALESRLESLQQDRLELVRDIESRKSDLKELHPKVLHADKFDSLNKEFEELDSQLVSEESVISLTDREIAELQKKLDHLSKSQCPTCRQQWVGEEYVEKIKEYEDAIEEKNQIKQSVREKISKINEEMSRIEKEVTDIPDEVIDDGDKIREEFKNVEASIRKSETLIDSYDRQLEETNRKLDEIASLDVSEISKKLEDLKGTRSQKEKNLDSLNQKVAESESKINEIVAELKAMNLSGNEVEFENLINKAKTALEEVHRLNAEECPFDDPDESKMNLKDTDELEKKISDLGIDIRHCNYLVKLLTDSKSFIRRNIIGKYVPYLNKMINKYADQLDSPHICSIEDDLSVSIEYMNRSVSYHNLSAGEKLKLDISVAVALRDLMGMLGTRSDFLIVDEVFDSALDGQSKRNVFRLISDRFDKVLLVSHSGEFDDKCDMVWTVTKSNGFSQISFG